MSSVRQDQARKERLEWERQFENEKRAQEDLAQWQAYSRDVSDKNRTLAPARKEALIEFATLGPFLTKRANEPLPALRFAVAMNDYLTTRDVARKRELSETPVAEWNPDLLKGIPPAVENPDSEKVNAAAAQLGAEVPMLREYNRAQRAAFVERVANFAEKNNLSVESIDTWRLVYRLQHDSFQLDDPLPEPEQFETFEEREEREAKEKQERRRAFFEDVIAVHPVTLEPFTAQKLERADSETYKAVVGLQRVDNRAAVPARRA